VFWSFRKVELEGELYKESEVSVMVNQLLPVIVNQLINKKSLDFV